MKKHEIGGPESYMNAKKSVSEIKFQVDSDPVLKMLSERNRSPSAFHLIQIVKVPIQDTYMRVSSAKK